MTTNDTALAVVIGLLDDVAVQIRALEAEAELLLHEQNDPEGSEANMRRKAELLGELPDTLESALDGLDEDVRERVERAADGFSRRGMMALEQGSVFWMRNLLYPEDYKDGEPNDLERFTAGLAKAS